MASGGAGHQQPASARETAEHAADLVHHGRHAYWCDVCNVRCGSAKHWKAHLAGRKHSSALHEREDMSTTALSADQGDRGTPRDAHDPDHMSDTDHRAREAVDARGTASVRRKAAESSSWWRGSTEQFSEFPFKGRTLDHNVMVASLEARTSALLDGYLLDALPGCPELVRALRAAAVALPTGLRLKELIESVEVVRIAAPFIASRLNARVVAGDDRAGAASSAGDDRITAIFDLAAGHGLVGILMAYRFPKLKVTCVDLVQRPGFEAVVAAVREHGEADSGEEFPLSNLDFVEGDMAAVELRGPKGGRAAVVSVHACNEALLGLMCRSKEARAAWVTVPCCIKAGLVGVTLRCGGDDESADTQRHAVACGIVAGVFGAHQVTSVDARITNRNVALMGDFADDTRKYKM